MSLLFNQTRLNERRLPNYTHTHTHTHIYIYMCVCVFMCVCMCVCVCVLIDCLILTACQYFIWLFHA